MQYQVFTDYDALSEHAAQFMLELVRQKPTAVICVASGDTPLGTFQKVVANALPNDFAEATFVALDEWVGIDPQNPGSCRSYVEKPLIEPLKIPAERVCFFDGMATNLAEECARVNEFVARRGGLDLIFVGIGTNGHIGLNEPGSSFENYAHISDLQDVTIAGGQKYFQDATPLTQGVTLGLRHFLEAKTAIVIANGPRKKDIIGRVLNEPIDTALPASVLHQHPNGYLWVDEAANAKN
jgi:glucosamine-6-phosphate isomerase